jgi:hypothetical protein
MQVEMVVQDGVMVVQDGDDMAEALVQYTAQFGVRSLLLRSVSFTFRAWERNP